MVEGHRGTDMPWSLNATASGAKTGVATHSFERNGESRLGLGLRRSARPQPARYDRTSRNMTSCGFPNAARQRHVRWQTDGSSVTVGIIQNR